MKTPHEAFAEAADIRGHTLVVVVTQAPGDEGAAYTLTLPSGEQAVIGDAQDAYGELAHIIDDAFEHEEVGE